ncbi:MAG TPA: hypothetical protein VFQ80_09475 [Thermomicrobiales bacterium]|jgi:hypothetical protein|nr:hypothetical protein [Thermomicrobiales bacterium]
MSERRSSASDEAAREAPERNDAIERTGVSRRRRGRDDATARANAPGGRLGQPGTPATDTKKTGAPTPIFRRFRPEPDELLLLLTALPGVERTVAKPPVR